MARLISILIAAALLCGLPAFAAQPSPDAMNALATEKGCDLCHRAEPGKPGPSEAFPLAPSWKDIARRYRGQKGAEDRLVEIVLSGSGGGGKEVHWSGKISGVAMLPNVKEIDEGQARQLVHWILSSVP